MITADQLTLHLIGDYILQSNWMASNKTKHWYPAICHALLYTLPFLMLTNSVQAIIIILVTHYFIDRYRLARYVVWAKNWLGPNRSWAFCKETGYPADCPIWLSNWLLIIADNIIHIVINGIAIRYF